MKNLPLLLGILLLLASPFVGWGVLSLSHIQGIAFAAALVFGAVGFFIALLSYLNGID